jgi:chromosome segregation ATPase
MLKKWEYQTNSTEATMQEIRVITELDLVEISVVSTPANPGSIFTLAKSVREYFLTQKSDEATTTEGIKEEIIESVQPEAQKTEEVPAQEAQPTETQPQTTETSGATPETPAVVVVEEAQKAETPSEVEILTSEVNALKTKLEELAKLNEALVSENAKLKTDNGEKDKAISELSTKTISLEEKMSKVGVRRATIVSGTDTVRAYKTITYRDLIK